VLAAGGAANWSATAQPVAHGDWLWNTLALVLVYATAMRGAKPAVG
jgi:hypothetical protein